MNQDGYTRLREQGPLLGNEPQGPRPILFVDVEPGGPPDSIRRVPHSYLATVRAVIARGSQDDVDSMRAILEAIDRKVPCIRIDHVIGTSAVLDGDGIKTEDAQEFVARARTAELRSMLNLGEAVWESKNFHFVLPSGRHARTFIRPAHAIRSLRDAQVIALWLLSHLAADGSGIVADTHVLAAVILALQTEAQNRGAKIGKVRILDGYPATTVDTGVAIRAVTEELPSLLAIVSVCGTGGVRDLIASAAREATFVERADIVSIFDVSAEGVVHSPAEDTVKISSLIHLGDSRDTKRFASYDTACALCERAETAQLVPVDVDTFDVRFPAFVEREMPSVIDPQRNRSLWEACHRTNAISLEADPDEQVKLWRATGKMTWKVDWDRLLADKTFRERVAVRLAEELRAIAKAEKARGLAETIWNDFDLVLVPGRDSARPQFGDFWSVVGTAFATSAPIAFPDYGEWGDALYEQVRSAKRILVLTLGTVTGSTLQRSLNEIQRTRRDVDYDLHGLVIHARPARRRLWQVLMNSYAHRLVAAFVTYVPDSFSPLRDEAKHLEADVARLSPDAQAFLQKRLALCRGEHVPGHGFLWGATANESISPHSIFGDRLDARSTFMAVASALQARREAERNPPYRMLFEMPAIARSYYDPVIFACMLRWLQTPEIWWGDLRADAENVLGEVISRAVPAQRPLLVGELLLASAQGKIPRRGLDCVLAQAEALGDITEAAGMLELGRHLVRAKL